MVNTLSRPLEVIEKKGEIGMKGVKNCSTCRKAFETLLADQTRRGNIELQRYTERIIEIYNRFHPKTELQVEGKSWKGKSSFDMIMEYDKLVVTKWQKADEDSKPKPFSFTFTHEEIKWFLESINYVWSRNEDEKGIKTEDIAFQYCLKDSKRRYERGDLFEGEFKKNLYKWRMLHYWITIFLGALDRMQLTTYKKGKTILLKNKLDLQTVLDRF